MLSVTIVLLRAVYTLFKRPLGCPKHIYSIVKVKMVVKEAVKTRKFVCLLVIDLMEAGNVLMEAGNVRQSLEKRSKGAVKTCKRGREKKTEIETGILIFN